MLGAASSNWIVGSDADGSNIIAGANTGHLYTSSDYGATWIDRLAENRNWTSVASDSVGNNLIAGGNNGGGDGLGGRIFISPNGGLSWMEGQPHGDVDAQWQGVASDSAGTALMACENGGHVWHSSDSGIFWSAMEPDMYNSTAYWYAVAMSDDGTVLIACSGSPSVNPGLWVSTNSGESWTQRNPVAGYGCISVGCNSDGSFIIAAATTSSGLRRLYTSSNYGASWTETQPVGNATRAWRCVACDADGSHLMAGIDSGRLYSSADSGATWVEDTPAGSVNKSWNSVATNSDGSRLIAGCQNVYIRTSITTITATDVAPSTISNALLTNTLYGLGLDSAVFDATTAAITDAYCVANDMLVSMVIDTQVSVLDALEHLTSHHDGFITYAGGTITHGQLKAEAPIAALVADSGYDIVHEEGAWPVQVTVKGARDYYNRIIVEWTKRNSDYVTGTAPIDDMGDIALYGLRPKQVLLDGLCTWERAIKAARVIADRSMSSESVLTFKLGPKHQDLKPGDVITITDSNNGLTAFKCRLVSISENPDFVIEAVAVEEIDNVYTYSTAGAEAGGGGTTMPDFYSDALAVTNGIAVELPAIYSGEKNVVVIGYSKPDQPAWAGAALYRSYAAAGPYTRQDSKTYSGVAGAVTAVGTVAGEQTITVLLGTDATLSSATTFNELMTTPRMNICVFATASGNKFCRYQTVTLVAANTWRLSGLIYDAPGVSTLNSYGAIDAGDPVLIYSNIPFTRELGVVDAWRDIWWKVASFNFAGAEQDLSAVTALTTDMQALAQTPLTVCNLSVNGTPIAGSGGGTASTPAGDIALAWVSRNRFADAWLDYTRTDSVDDYDFVEFRIEVMSGTTVVRTVTQATKTWTYTTAMQAADALSSPFTFKIYQRGASATSAAVQLIVTTT